MQQPLPFEFNSELNLTNFITTNNKNIIYQLDKLINNLNFNLLIYGNNYGKTHLLHAYTLLALEKNLSVLYLNLKDNPNFLTNINELSLDILFLDNLELASPTTQKQLFDLYNQNINIVLSANTDNNNLDLLPDLNTRINKSIKLELQDLSDTNKIKVLKLKIKQHNITINDLSLNYLINNYSRDLKNLIYALDALNQNSLVNKAKITPQLIKKVLLK
jgi:chromosomal replication initiation ATPase DnaA